jgi:hypothetical protein
LPGRRDHYKHVGLNSHQVKIGEVLVGVVAEVFLHDRRINGKASRGANADRITVRCGLRGCPAFLLNIEKRSLPRLMLSGDGLASNEAV